MRVVGVGVAHISPWTRPFAPFLAVQSTHARPRIENAAVGQPHLECQGRRQRHSHQRLRLRTVARRPAAVNRNRIWKSRGGGGGDAVDVGHAKWAAGDPERAALHHQEDQGWSGQRGGDEWLEVCGDGGRSALFLDLFAVSRRSDDRNLHGTHDPQD